MGALEVESIAFAGGARSSSSMPTAVGRGVSLPVTAFRDRAGHRTQAGSRCVRSGRIYVVNADGTNEVPITNPVAPEHDLTPSWSRDGATIAFVRMDDEDDFGCVSSNLWMVEPGRHQPQTDYQRCFQGRRPHFRFVVVTGWTAGIRGTGRHLRRCEPIRLGR